MQTGDNQYAEAVVDCNIMRTSGVRSETFADPAYEPHKNLPVLCADAWRPIQVQYTGLHTVHCRAVTNSSTIAKTMLVFMVCGQFYIYRCLMLQWMMLL